MIDRSNIGISPLMSIAEDSSENKSEQKVIYNNNFINETQTNAQNFMTIPSVEEPIIFNDGLQQTINSGTYGSTLTQTTSPGIVYNNNQYNNINSSYFTNYTNNSIPVLSQSNGYGQSTINGTLIPNNRLTHNNNIVSLPVPLSSQKDTVLDEDFQRKRPEYEDCY